MSGGLRRAIKLRIRRLTGVAQLEAGVEARFRHVADEHAAASEEAIARDEALERRLAALEGLAQIPLVMEEVRRATLQREPLISVVLPTRDRARSLARALASVRAQTYEAWELIVVDDGSNDETPDVLEEVDDERVSVVRLDGRGVTAARNAGLAEAKGELIAYLDDDNLMHEQWLRTVAWAFERRPEAAVVYGAFVLDDTDRVAGGSGGGAPRIVFRPFDRGQLGAENPADISAVAHRAGLAEARFDEDLSMYGDWELLIRLTGDAEPFAVPAIAAFYGTDAPERLSAQPIDPAEQDAVVRALRAHGDTP